MQKVIEKYSREAQECIIKDNIVMGKMSIPEKNLNAGRMILRSLSEYSNLIGMIEAETGEKTTFAEMKDRSIRCALWLRKLGIGDNDVVAVSTPSQMNDYIPFLATVYINAIFNPWPQDSTPEQAQYCFGKCKPKVMFACKESIDKLAAIAKEKGYDCKFIVFERNSEHPYLQDILAEQTQDEVDHFQCSDEPSDPNKKISQIFFSSGTTGIPKAILLSYQNLLSRRLEQCNLQTGMTCLWYSGLAWITCMGYILSTIRMHCTRVVHRTFDVEATAEVVQKYKVNYMLILPYWLSLSQKANVFTRYDFSHLKTISFGGAKLAKIIFQECRKNLPKVSLINCYGLTESGGWVSRQTPNCKSIESAGFLCENVQLKVIDPSNESRLLGPNQEGELCVKSNTLTLGYLGDPVETKRVLHQDGWLRTGDLGFYDENGEITVSGRIKDLIRIIGSISLTSSELEEALMQHPDVKECAVLAVDHLIDGERPFAFVVTTPNAKVTARELKELLVKKNKHYQLNGGLAFVEKLFYTTNGKKCLRILREMAKMYIQQ